MDGVTATRLDRGHTYTNALRFPITTLAEDMSRVWIYGEEKTPLVDWIWPIRLNDRDDADLDDLILEIVMWMADTDLCLVDVYDDDDDDTQFSGYAIARCSSVLQPWSIIEAYVRFGFAPPLALIQAADPAELYTGTDRQRVLAACLWTLEAIASDLQRVTATVQAAFTS